VPKTRATRSLRARRADRRRGVSPRRRLPAVPRRRSGDVDARERARPSHPRRL